MKHARLSIVIASLGAATVLSGCNGSSSAGGLAGGGGGGGQDFETFFNAVSQKAPTSDMPTSLKASYEGQMKVGVNSGSAQIFGTDIDANSAEIIGDLAVDVDWTDGQTTNPFTGTASNIVATEAGTSNSVKLDGTLTVDQGLPASLSRTTIPAQVVAGVNIPEQNTGAMLFHMSGRLSSGKNEGDATLQFGGNFMGPGAESMLGPVSGGINDVNNPSPQIFDAGVGGTFYANKK